MIGGNNQNSGQINQQIEGNTASEDGSDSQAMSSIKQGDDGTLASASAEGKFGQGSAKSQVSGIYTGTGSFSAQAGTSDNMKSAQTQVKFDSIIQIKFFITKPNTRLNIFEGKRRQRGS